MLLNYAVSLAIAKDTPGATPTLLYYYFAKVFISATHFTFQRFSIQNSGTGKTAIFLLL